MANTPSVRTKNGVPCPECGDYDSKVTNSRPSGGRIYRRRECVCGNRYSTYETVVDDPYGERSAVRRLEGAFIH